MRVDASLTDPQLLCEQPIGGLFVCHLPSTCDLVLMRVSATVPTVFPAPDELHTVVVIGCRGIGRRDPGFVHDGALLELDGKSPVTVLVPEAALLLKAVTVRSDYPPIDPT